LILCNPSPPSLPQPIKSNSPYSYPPLHHPTSSSQSHVLRSRNQNCA
jgi:hypothetical protein